MLTGQFKLNCFWAGEISIPVFYLYPSLEGQEGWPWLRPFFKRGWSGSHDSTASSQTSTGRVEGTSDFGGSQCSYFPWCAQSGDVGWRLL